MYEHFRMEGMPVVVDLLSQLLDKDMYQRCLLCDEYCVCRPQVPEILMERENFGLQRVTIRPGIYTSSVHKKIDTTQIARFVWPTWGPPGGARTHVGPVNLATRAVMALLRRVGVRIVIWLDDMLLMHQQQQMSAIQTKQKLGCFRGWDFR